MDMDGDPELQKKKVPSLVVAYEHMPEYITACLT